MRPFGLACLAVVLTCTAIGAGRQRDTFAAQPSVDAAFAVYLRSLAERVKDPRLGVYSPETQRLLSSRTITDAQQDRELAAVRAVYARRVLTERGLLAVIRFPDAGGVPPYFFRRNDAGWTIDLAATSRVIGFDRANRWYVRDPASEFAFGW